jgi:CRP-like cAMP-binding protein
MTSISANRLLAALPAAELQHLLPHLETVPLSARTVVQSPGQPITHVYFPTTAVLSLVNVLRTGTDVEVGLIGSEGMAGLPIFLRAEKSPARCLVQVTGEALRMPAASFHAAVASDCRLHHLLLRYTSAFLTQLSQCGACNAQHSVEQRCCRWLLMTHNRVQADRFQLTHAFLATMLGVRRAGVTEVARSLRDLGLVRYTRGWVTILDREGLRDAACECYGVIQAEFERLLGEPV